MATQQKYNKLAGKHVLVIGGTSGMHSDASHWMSRKEFNFQISRRLTVR